MLITNFFCQVLRLCETLWVMTDHKCLVHTSTYKIEPGLCPLFSISALPCHFLFLFYFIYSYLTSICNRMVMTDLSPFPLPITAKSNDLFLFLHFCVVLPPLLHRYRSAFGLPALLSLSLIPKTTCCQVVPLLPGPLSASILPPYLSLRLDSLPPLSSST